MHGSADGEVAVVAILLEPSGLPSPVIDQVIESAPGDAGREVDTMLGGIPLELFLDFDPPTAVVDSCSTPTRAH